MSTGIVLSRTEMNFGRFCTCVLIKENGVYRQARLMKRGGHHFAFEDIQPSALRTKNLWWRGRIVELKYFCQTTPRDTHPEDYWISSAGIRITGKVIRDAQLFQMEASYTFGAFSDLYPTLETRNRKAFLVRNKLARSVGNVFCREIIIYANAKRAELIDGTGRTINVPVKGESLLMQLKTKTQIRFKDVYARLSLANSFASEHWEGERCYVMLSEVII